jgi:hypothetical protein
MKQAMGMVTHKDNPIIPSGFAALVINNSGWCGTNNGYPFYGQPALFPIAQANAIMYAWNAFLFKDLPNPDGVPDDVKKWLT